VFSVFFKPEYEKAVTIGSIIDLRFPKSLYDSYRDRSDETCQR